MTPDIWQNRRTAYHEAGHAVVGWLLGEKILAIQLFGSKRGNTRFEKRGTTWFETRGTTWFDDRYQPRQLACIMEAEGIIPDISIAMSVVMILAGIEAELRLGPYDAVFRDYVGRRERGIIPADHVEITKLLCPERGYRQVDVDTMIRPLLAACSRLVEAHWPQIEALAEALLADGQVLRRKEVRRMLGQRTMPLRNMILGIAHLVAEARVEAWRASVEAGSPSQLKRLLSLREERAIQLRVDLQACRIDVTGAHLLSKLFAGRLALASVRRV